MSARPRVFRPDPEKPPKSVVSRPHFARAVRIAHDHILHAEARPEDLAALAAKLEMSEGAALAFAIVDEISEEFTLVEREG